jgi:hypothetical protein
MICDLRPAIERPREGMRQGGWHMYVQAMDGDGTSRWALTGYVDGDGDDEEDMRIKIIIYLW